MKWARRLIQRVARASGVAKVRHITERVFAPYLRADLEALHATLITTGARLDMVEARLDGLTVGLDSIEAHQPAVLNAISSTNGTARLLRREFDALSDEIRQIRETVPLERS
jgi:hypothetical protein